MNNNKKLIKEKINLRKVDFYNCIPKKIDIEYNPNESERCKAHRKELQDQKITIVTNHGNYTLYHKRHPKLKELTFAKKDPVINEHPTEEIPKELRLENRPFAKIHNDLINNLYLTPNRLKQATIIAKHEKDIEKMIERINMIKDNIKHRYMVQKSNYRMLIYKYNYNHTDIIPIITKYVNKPLAFIKDIMYNLNKKLSSNMKDYCNITLCEKNSTKQIVTYFNNKNQLLKDCKINIKYKDGTTKTISKDTINEETIIRYEKFLTKYDNNFLSLNYFGIKS